MSALGEAFVFHTDSTESTTNPALKKAKMDNVQQRVPQNKRAALGVITNSTRIQPLRTAKGGYFDGTDAGPTKGKSFSNSSMGFSIHIDDESSTGPSAPTATAVVPTESLHTAPKLPLSSTITAMRQPFAPLSEIHDFEEESPSMVYESPMMLDASLEPVKHEEDPEDIIKARLDQILTVPEYAADIYAYLREAELRNRPRVRYMKRQPDITSSMRNILVDWLVEVAEEYKLHRESLFLAVNYIDRFLSQMSVLRGKLQLVGAASMFLAAKYEEIYPPEVKEFVYITDNSYTNSQVLRMEHLILKVLSFDVAIPTINCFCEKFAREAELDDETLSLAMYLSELTLVEGESFLKYLPSTIAAASICIANHTLEREAWPASMRECTSYDLTDFSDCVHDLHALHVKAINHPQRAVFEKYKKSKYNYVATLLPRMDKPEGLLPMSTETEDMPH